jgi:bifunctional non-homologous end joining protein LigD
MLHEIKLDGYRLLGFVSGGTSRLRTRNGKDWTESFPSPRRRWKTEGRSGCQADMEAVILDAEGRAVFGSAGRSWRRRGKPERLWPTLRPPASDGKDLTAVRRPSKEKLQALLKNEAGRRLRQLNML